MQNPITSADFESEFAAKPDADFTGVDCEARGLSVRRNLVAAEKFIKSRRKRYKTVTWFVAKAEFVEPNGMVAKTFQHVDHYTWWPENIANCSQYFAVLENN
jgi:hypothetical protein